MIIQVRVIRPSGEEKIIDLCDSEEQMKTITVKQLKEKIMLELEIGTDQVQLIFGSRSLEDSSLLSSYGIRHMSTIRAVLLLPGGGGDPGKGDGGMGDKDGKNRSMERLFLL